MIINYCINVIECIVIFLGASTALLSNRHQQLLSREGLPPTHQLKNQYVLVFISIFLFLLFSSCNIWSHSLIHKGVSSYVPPIDAGKLSDCKPASANSSNIFCLDTNELQYTLNRNRKSRDKKYFHIGTVNETKIELAIRCQLTNFMGIQ